MSDLPKYFVRNNQSSILGVNSQNFLGEFVRFFLTFGHKILRLFILKVLFEADCIKYCLNYKVPKSYEKS